jgi:hypothetical protein
MKFYNNKYKLENKEEIKQYNSQNIDERKKKKSFVNVDQIGITGT